MEPKTVGALLRKIRSRQDLTVEVVAGRAGLSAGFWSRVERGEAVLDRLSHWRGVAHALGVPLSDLMRLEVPAPGNGHTDSAIEAIRNALAGVAIDHPGGEVLPVPVLQQRVARVHNLDRQCRFQDVGQALPGLISDLHTTLAAGRGLATLLPLAVLLHVCITGPWLSGAAAPTDLQRQAMFLARRLAQEHNEAPSLVSAAYGLAGTLVVDGSLELAQTVINETPLPPVTGDTAGLVCATLAAPQAQLLAVQGSVPTAPLAEAAEIADRFGEIGAADPYGFGFGPTTVGFWRIRAALELGDVDDAVRSVHTVHPERAPFRTGQAFYWTNTGRALALADGPVDEAVRAHLRAEAFLPVTLYRNLITREVLRELLTRAPGNEDLRQLASRASLDQR
ncbi:MAG: helix-turn-helix domain-containing protein [Pseudonocardiaceae bacterium]